MDCEDFTHIPFVRHALFIYVDDGLVLLPSSVAPLLATCVTMLLVTLSESWRKLELGAEIVWVGWKFCFNTGFVSLPVEKAQKILALLCPLCRLKAEVCKSELERLIGLLVWFTHGAVWPRP